MKQQLSFGWLTQENLGIEKGNIDAIIPYHNENIDDPDLNTNL